MAICLGLGFLNILIFVALGSESKTHAAVFFMGLVSYWILRKQTFLNDKALVDGPRKAAPNIAPHTHSPSTGSREKMVRAAAKSDDQQALKEGSLRRIDEEARKTVQPGSEWLMDDFENARTAIKFRREARTAWDQIAILPHQQQQQFLGALDKQPDADVAALADKIIAKYHRPFENDEINDAYEKIWEYGEKAREEFRKAIEVLGNEVDLDFVISQLDFDPGFGNAITDFQAAKEFLTNSGYEMAEVNARDGAHLVAKKGSSVRHFYDDATLIEHANKEYKAKYNLDKK
jgi:hypothetical protein